MQPQPRISATFAALRHRNFRYFMAGQCISLIGTLMESTAQQWLVYSITKSAFLLGLIGVFQFGPVFLLSLFAGVIIDRLPKRSVLLVTQGIFTIQSLLLTIFVWSGHVTYVQVAVLSVIYGIAQAFDLPVRQAFVIDLAGREDLMNAISINSTVFNLSRILGPVFAGAIIVGIGVNACFLINTVSFLPVLYAVWKIDVKGLSDVKSGFHPLYEIGEGLTHIFKDKLLFFVVLMLFNVCTFCGNMQVILPVFTSEVLKMNADSYSLLLSAMGAGAFLSAILMASRAKKGLNIWMIVATPIGLGLVQIAAFFLHSFSLAALASAVLGFLWLMFLNMANSVMQFHSTSEFRGRVMSVYGMFVTGTAPIGNFLVGLAMQMGGGSWGFLFCGIMTLALAVPIDVYHSIKKA